jgi:hypothetical protein
MNPHEPPEFPVPSLDDDGRLEQRLRESSQPYIDDAGFTARIIGALPPSRRRAERRRSLLLFGAALLGCGLMAVLGGSSPIAFIATVMDRLAAWSTLPVPVLGATNTVGVLACWVLALAAGGWAWARAR